nr:hypothetical protein [Clostridia bacterium]
VSDSPDGTEHTEDKVVGAAGHAWAFTGFTWTGDDGSGYTAAAGYCCSVCGSEKAVNAYVSVSTEPPTPATDGRTEYTASVAAADSPDGTARCDSKTVIIPATVETEPDDAPSDREDGGCRLCGEDHRGSIKGLFIWLYHIVLYLLTKIHVPVDGLA